MRGPGLGCLCYFQAFHQVKGITAKRGRCRDSPSVLVRRRLARAPSWLALCFYRGAGSRYVIRWLRERRHIFCGQLPHAKKRSMSCDEAWARGMSLWRQPCILVRASQSAGRISAKPPVAHCRLEGRTRKCCKGCFLFALAYVGLVFHACLAISL